MIDCHRRLRASAGATYLDEGGSTTDEKRGFFYLVIALHARDFVENDFVRYPTFRKERESGIRYT